MVSFSIVVCFAALAVATATEVLQCPGKSIDNLSNDVQLSPCKKTPCKLKKGSNQKININFIPAVDIPEVKNHVTADVFGIELPFIGVDGLSVCDKIYLEDGEKAACPLKAGTKYTYKDAFPILSFYPVIQLKVHWELKDNDDKDFVCFEVPAKITT